MTQLLHIGRKPSAAQKSAAMEVGSKLNLNYEKSRVHAGAYGRLNSTRMRSVRKTTTMFHDVSLVEQLRIRTRKHDCYAQDALTMT